MKDLRDDSPPTEFVRATPADENTHLRIETARAQRPLRSKPADPPKPLRQRLHERHVAFATWLADTGDGAAKSFLNMRRSQRAAMTFMFMAAGALIMISCLITITVIIGHLLG